MLHKTSVGRFLYASKYDIECFVSFQRFSTINFTTLETVNSTIIDYTYLDLGRFSLMKDFPLVNYLPPKQP